MQQGAAVGLARLHVRRAQHPLVAGLFQVAAVAAVHAPEVEIEPVDAQRQPGDELGPVVPGAQVGPLVGQDVGPLLGAETRHQIDARSEIPHHAGGGDAVGHIDAVLLPHRKAQPAAQAEIRDRRQAVKHRHAREPHRRHLGHPGLHGLWGRQDGSVAAQAVGDIQRRLGRVLDEPLRRQPRRHGGVVFRAALDGHFIFPAVAAEIRRHFLHGLDKGQMEQPPVPRQAQGADHAQEHQGVEQADELPRHMPPAQKQTCQHDHHGHDGGCDRHPEHRCKELCQHHFSSSP